MQTIFYALLTAFFVNLIWVLGVHFYPTQAAQPESIAEARVTPETNSALDALDKRCRNGEAESCHAMSTYLSTLGDKKSGPTRSRMYIEMACGLKLAEACLVLSQMFSNGYGGEKDTEKSLDLLLENCNGGHSVSCHILGHLILRDFVPEDLNHLETVLHAFKSGYELGNTGSCRDAELIEKHRRPQTPSASPTENPRRGFLELDPIQQTA